MSNTRKDRNKKWLISRLKTSGSKRDHYWQGHYRDSRNNKQKLDLEDLPKKESYSNTYKFYNGKINYGLLVRFLRQKVGQNWYDVQKEVFERIPTKLQEYKDCLYWFVADKTELLEEGLWCKREHKFLILKERGENRKWNEEIYKEFYVDPENQKLVQVVLESQKKTKKLNRSELRKFREDEKKEKLNDKKEKNRQTNRSIELTKLILKTKNKEGSL